MVETVAEQQGVANPRHLTYQHVVPTFSLPPDTRYHSLQRRTVSRTDPFVRALSNLPAHIILYVVDRVPSDVLK